MNKFVISLFSVAALTLTSSLYATGTDTWTGLGGNNNWTTAGNWTGTNTPPVSGAGVGDNLIFNGNTRTTNNNDYAPNGGWSSVTFAAGAGAFNLQGNGIGFDFTQPGNSTLANLSPNVQTLNFNNNAGLDGQGFAPFGQIVTGMDVVDKLYAEYGEGAPRGNGPDQGRLQREGNAYLTKEFSRMDFVKKATIVP